MTTRDSLVGPVSKIIRGNGREITLHLYVNRERIPPLAATYFYEKLENFR